MNSPLSLKGRDDDDGVSHLESKRRMLSGVSIPAACKGHSAKMSLTLAAAMEALLFLQIERDVR